MVEVGDIEAGTRAEEDLPHACGRCPRRWSGYGTAHCGGGRGCHRTFSGVTTFDQHRDRRGGGHCLDPAGLGMALLSGRAYDVWGRPSTQETDDDPHEYDRAH